MRFIKKTVAVITGLIIILAVGGYIFARSFDLNRYKSYIADIVMQETGRVLTMDGDARLGISLIPTVEINDVALSNPEWAQNPQMVKLQKLEVKVAILPLLNKQIVVDKLILQKPEIYLETANNGQNNWTFTAGVQTENKNYQEAAQPKIKNAGAVAAVGLIAREVLLKDGLVSYYDAKSRKTTNLIINDIEMSVAGGNEPINLEVDAVYDGQKIVAEIEANNLNSLMNEGKVDFKASAKALKVSAKFAGAAEDVLSSPRYAIEGNIHNPAGNFGAPETSLDLRVDGDVASADIVIKNLNIATNEVTGTVKADWSKAKPKIKADLASAVFDVNRLQKSLATSWVLPSFISQAHALEVVPNETVPYEFLTMVDADLDAKIGKLVLADDMVMKNVVLAAKLQNGILDVDKLNAGIGGGTVTAKMAVNAAKQSISFDLASNNLKAQDLDPDLATNQGSDMQFLSGGNLDVVAKLTTQGATYRKLSENLDGQVIAILDKSEIKTGQISWLTNNVLGQLLAMLKVDTQKSTNMNVECAVVRTDIKNGKAVFPNGIVFNGSKLKIVSNGSINLVNDKLDFTVAPSMNKLADGNITQALSSFVKLGGTIKEPKLKLDTQTALTTIVGTVAAGGAYIGSEMLLNGDNSPCYGALTGTQYASRFPKPTGAGAVTKETYKDVREQTKEVVKGLEGAAKNLIGAFGAAAKKGK